MNEMKSYFKKLLKGEVTLFISFWFWFVALSFFIKIFFEDNLDQVIFTNNKFSDILLFLIMFFYSIVIFIIIFKSANNYKGNKLWSFIAKTIVTINLFFSISSFIEIIKFNFFEDYTIKKEIESFKSSLPIQVDPTSILSDIYKKEKIIFYKYTLFNISLKDRFDKKRFKKRVQDSLCEDETSLYLLKKDYILNYEYKNEKEEVIINIQTTKENCGKSIYDLEILKKVLQKQGML